MCKDAVVGTDAIAETERYRDDAQAARGQRLAGDELNTAHHDGREHHDRCAAKHRLRHDRDERAQLGHQTAENQEDAAGGQRKAVDDFGHADKADILAEGGVGQYAEQCGKAGTDTIADDAAGQLSVGGLSVHAAHDNAGNIAHGFDRRDDEHNHDRCDRAHIKHRLDRHQLGQCKPFGLGHLIPVQHPCLGVGNALGVQRRGGQNKAHEKRCNVAADDAHQNRGGIQKGAAGVLADQDDDQHKDGEQQVFDRAEILRGVAAAEGVYTDRNQAQTDGKHHRAGNDRGQQLAQRLQKEAQHGLKQAADQGRAHDCAVGQHTAAHRGCDRAEYPDEAGGGAHDDRHLAADGADGIQLNQCDDARHKHGILQQRDAQVGKFAAGQAAGARDDKQRRKVANKHRQHMLHAQRQCLLQGHLAFKAEGFRGKIVFLHSTTPQVNYYNITCTAKAEGHTTLFTHYTIPHPVIAIPSAAAAKILCVFEEG